MAPGGSDDREAVRDQAVPGVRRPNQYSAWRSSAVRVLLFERLERLMQTWLPYESFAESAAVLDRQRLSKQRNDTLLIARCLAGEPSSWKNHPAVKMWRGYEQALLRYQDECCFQWAQVRGYSDTLFDETTEVLIDFVKGISIAPDPWWLGDVEFHYAHQAALYREDPKYFSKFFIVDSTITIPWPGDEKGEWR